MLAGVVATLNAVRRCLYRRHVRAPAILGIVSLFWGSRTEILLEDGRRPISPVAVLGLRIAPLRFENDKGYVSALETVFGLGPYKGRCLEVSILAVGIRL